MSPSTFSLAAFGHGDPPNKWLISQGERFSEVCLCALFSLMRIAFFLCPLHPVSPVLRGRALKKKATRRSVYTHRDDANGYQATLNAWCELFGRNLSGRCPQIRVGLLTDPEGKGPTPYARCGHLPHHTLRYGRRLQPLPAAKKAARSPSLPLRERGAYPGHLCPLEPFHQREGFLPLR